MLRMNSNLLKPLQYLKSQSEPIKTRLEIML